MLALGWPEILGNRVEEWEYYLMWASPRKTVVVKPGGQVETLSDHSRSQDILAGLQAYGWRTVAFNIAPTVDMTYLFKRQIQDPMMAAKDKPTTETLMYPQGRTPYQQANASPSGHLRQNHHRSRNQ